jgi:murein DD-endopeptidase MepM/ murein hydrolase activator NlpD
MNKLGLGILIAILVVVGGFLSLTRFGGGEAVPAAEPRAAVLASAPEDADIAVNDNSAKGLLGVPVRGVARSAIADNWGDPREGGAREHHGIDIMAPEGTLVVAAAPGTVEKLFESDAGGTTLYVRSPDKNWEYYYAHLSGYAPGMHEGLIVKRGDPLGYVGDTGNAGAGNYHLHFGVARIRPDDGWWQGQPINPYPLLAARAAGR